jgi:hypothetical protein
VHKILIAIGLLVAVDHFVLDGELIIKQLRALTA